MKILTRLTGNDPLGIGLEREVSIEFDDPMPDGNAWKTNFRLQGSDRTFERWILGETPLQSVGLAVQLIRDLYEVELVTHEKSAAKDR